MKTKMFVPVCGLRIGACGCEWCVPMTHYWWMRVRLFLGLLAAGALLAQTADEDFKIYTEHPRLLLKAQRLKLLRRERERRSQRWQQLETLVLGKVQMPEPGFAAALVYQVSGEVLQVGRQAIAWAIAPAATDLRQLALVYDWCQTLLTEPAIRNLSERYAEKIIIARIFISKPAIIQQKKIDT